MDVEILLDTTEAATENLEQIDRRFQEWYAEGAEIRPNKKSFGKLTRLEGERRYLMDLAAEARQSSTANPSGLTATSQ